MNPFHAPYTISQDYGPTDFVGEPSYQGHAHFHRGIDLVGPWPGCPVFGAVPGACYAAGTDTDGANYVIEHADSGHWVYYWHLDSKPLVKPGERIDSFTQIGNMGKSGNATGYHTHFEVDLPGPWLGGTLKMTPTNPHPFLEEESEMTEQQHAEIIVQLLGDVLGGDPHYDSNQPDAFKGHVNRIVNAKEPLEERRVAKDFLSAYNWHQGSSDAQGKLDQIKKILS